VKVSSFNIIFSSIFFFNIICAQSPSQTTSVSKAVEYIKHADTYYWLSRARSSPVTDIDKNILYLTKAKNALDKIELTEETKILRLQVNNGLDECNIQRDEALEELRNYTPLFSLLTGTEDIIEYFDNPFEVAIEKSINGVIEGKAFFARYAFLLFVVVVTEPSDDSDLIIEIAHNYINNNTAFYALTTHELAGIMNEDEMNLLHKIDEHPDILNRINQAVGSKGIGIFEVVFNDQVDNLYYASSYYKFWNPNKEKFDNQMGSYEFVETPNRGALFILLLLFLGIPCTKIFEKLNKQSEGSYPPVWYGLVTALLSFIITAFLLRGLSLLDIDGGTFFWSPSGLGWISVLVFSMSLLPLFLVYIGSARIKSIGVVLNNPETISTLVLGTFLGSFTLLAMAATVRLGMESALTVIIPAILSAGVPSFFLGRAYSKSIMTGDQVSKIESLILLPALIVYTFFILQWDFQVLVYATLGLLFITFVANFAPKWIINALIKDDDDEAEEEKSGIDWLLQMIRAPEFYNESWKKEFNDVVDFVAETGLADESPEIEVVFIEADMGMGKTRVAKEIATSIEAKMNEQGFRTEILLGDCDEPYDGADLVPYEPFAQALADVLNVSRFSNPAKKAEELANSPAGQMVQGAIGAAGAGALGVLLDAGEDGQSQKADVDEIAKMIAETLTELCKKDENGKEGKVVFIIDDTQWIDPDSFELLEKIIDTLNTEATFQGQNKVSFIFTSRGENDKTKKYLQDAEMVKIDDSINQGILQNEKIVAGILEGLKFDIRTKQTLINYYNGIGVESPLQILQTLDTAVAKDMIDAYGENFILTKGADLKKLPPPQDYLRMVEELLNGLDSRLLDMLQCSAVLGKSFRSSIISEIFKVDMLDFLEMVKGAEAKHIVKDVSEEDDIYEFVEKRMVGIFRNLRKREDEEEFIPQMVREYHKRYVEIKEKEIKEKNISQNQIPYRDILSLASHSRAVADVYPEKALLYNSLAAARAFTRGLFKVANGFFKNALVILNFLKSSEKTEKALQLYIDYAKCKLDEQTSFDEVDELITRAWTEIAGLHYSTVDDQGIRREKENEAEGEWQYINSDGDKINEAETITRIRMLKIPDDWENVWINPDPDGHLQAAVISTDNDEEKVTHSIYHTEFESVKSGTQGVDEKYSWAQIEIRLLETLNHYRHQHWKDAAEKAKSVINDNNSNIAQKTRAEFYFIAADISRQTQEGAERSRDEHLRLLDEIENLLKTNQLRESDRIEVLKVQSELLNNVGMVITHNLKQYEKALGYFYAAIKINELPEINDQKGIGIANGGLGDCHNALEDFGQAENHYTINLNISRNNGDKQGIVRMTSMLGEIKLLNAKNEQDADTKENLLYEAENYYNESLMVAEDQKGSISILCALSGLLETIILSESFNKCKYVFEKIDENVDIILQGPDWAKDRLNQSIEKLKEKTDGDYEKEIENYYKIIKMLEL
jgi:hypothetical protein